MIGLSKGDTRSLDYSSRHGCYTSSCFKAWGLKDVPPFRVLRTDPGQQRWELHKTHIKNPTIILNVDPLLISTLFLRALILGSLS